MSGPTREERGIEGRGTPRIAISPAVEAQLRAILLQPVPTGSTERYDKVAIFFRRGLSPLEAARLYSRLSERRDPLRKLMERRLTSHRVPNLVDLLHQTSLGYSARTAPEHLDNLALQERFHSVTDRLTTLSTEPVTTPERVIEETYAEELYAEQAKRGLASSPISDERYEKLRREAEEMKLQEEREKYQREVREIARQSGLEESFVREVLKEYDKVKARRRHPGMIDPRSVPFLNTPVARSTRYFGEILSYVLPGVGLWEAYFGMDAGGNELSTGSRVLSVALELVPFAGKVLGKASLKVARGLARLAVATGIDPRKLLPFLRRMSAVSTGALKSAQRKVLEAIRSGKPLRLTKQERKAIEAIDGALNELSDVPGFRAESGGTFKPRKRPKSGRPRRSEADVPDIVGDVSKAAGQRLSRSAARKALDLINRRVAANANVRKAWVRATNSVMKKLKRRSKSLSREEMLRKGGLYDQAREQFWKEVWDGKQARAFFEEAGYQFTQRGRAPLHKDFLDLPKRLHDEIRISLDHIQPKAGNWRNALNPQNLRFVHQADNRLIDLIRRYMPSYWQ